MAAEGGRLNRVAEQLVVGGFHTCAVFPAGSLSCWGWNSFGQIGDGSNTDRTTPVAIPGFP